VKRGIAVALVLLFAAPGSAHAAGAFTLGKGFAPGVHVVKGGKAHFVWYQDGGDVDSVRYCQVPRGKTDCQEAQTLVGTGDATDTDDRAYVFTRSDGTVVVLASFRPQQPSGGVDKLMWRSDNGGSSFEAPQPVGDPGVGGSEDAVLGDQAFYMVTSNTVFTRATWFGGVLPDSSVDLAAKVDPQIVLDPSIAITSANSPVVTADGPGSAPDTLVFHHLSGGDPRPFEDPIEWGQGTISNEWQSVLAGGPDGIYAMLQSQDDGVCPWSVVFRKWEGEKFGKPFTSFRDFSGTGASTGLIGDLFQDDSGRLHNVSTKVRKHGFVLDPTDIRYARSPGGKQDFSESRSLVKKLKTGPRDLQVETAKDGEGFAVWGESVDDPKVQAVAVTPGK
jgi:hypothetical protein